MSNLSGIFVPVKDRRIIAIALLGVMLACSLLVRAQDPTARFRNLGGGGGSGAGDSLQHRKNDTITINFRFLDSSRLLKLDSSLNFSKKVPQPPTYINLGNVGTPARDLVFSPRMQSGWDAGWHAYDLYVFKVDETKFYNTTKPYSELGYLLGSKTEQIVDLFHTQNVLPNWNLAFEYRLINSPGSFQNQNTNHNNYRGSSWYQSKNKRYQNFFILVGSKLEASENGGLQNFHDLYSDSSLGNTETAVRLGNNLTASSGNPFSTSITTGTRYTNATYLLRQQYDLGQKDSIVTDTTVIPLFYPRLRLEHTLAYTTYHYRFLDQYSGLGFPPYLLDSAYYANYYHINYISGQDSFFRETHWHDLTNDFSIYQFPDSKNPQQFIKLGASLQLLNGIYDTSNLVSGSLINVTKRLHESNEFVHGEYRNKTRNRKWDIEAFGKLYLSGLDAGDYNVYISLQRYVSRKIGYLQVGFQNVNRTPSSVFDAASPFFYDTLKSSFSKENTTNIFASLDVPYYHLKLKGAYYLISNYAYFADYFKERQQSALFNMLQVTAEKDITLHGPWKWHTTLVLQQTAGSSPVHVPLIISYNKIGYEGTFGFRNLNINFGLEIRYVSGYKADGYAPLSGQFFTQSDTTIRQHLPDITPYLALRIRSFTAYLRAENANTMRFTNGFAFNNYNFIAPNYPSAALLIRFGFFWSFIN